MYLQAVMTTGLTFVSVLAIHLRGTVITWDKIVMIAINMVWLLSKCFSSKVFSSREKNNRLLPVNENY